MRNFERKLFNKEEVLNELFDRLTVAGGLSHRSLDSSGLTIPYGSTTLFIYGQWVDISEGSLIITASSTNYVELSVVDPFTISTNTTAFTPGRVPLFEVDTNSTDVTAVRDRRRMLDLGQLGENTTQKIDYAASVTPDAFDGRYVEIGELTGAITIENPTNSPISDGTDSGIGCELYIMLEQDATGSRAITWGSDYVVTLATGGADERCIVHFIFDRGKWVAVGTPVWDS
jgi:hypothetical protein